MANVYNQFVLIAGASFEGHWYLWSDCPPVVFGDEMTHNSGVFALSSNYTSHDVLTAKTASDDCIPSVCVWVGDGWGVVGVGVGHRWGPSINHPRFS